MALCEVFLALNLTLGGFCHEAPAVARGVPDSDPAVFAYVKPDPPKPKPVPKFVTMPPVIVEKQVIKEVPKPVIQEKEVVKTEYVTKYRVPPKVEPRGPSELELRLQAALRERTAAQGSLSGSDLKDGFTDTASASVSPANPNLPAFPPPAGIDPANDRYAAPLRYSTTAVDNTRILTNDRYITGILESGINSQLADSGSVVVQVSRDVYGYHGRTKLVPKGSRLVCHYKSVDEVGQTRVGFSCNRVLLGESRAEIYQLKAQAGDAQGYAGVSGEVDNRFWEKYGSAILTVGIGAAVEGAVNAASSVDQSNSNVVSNGLSGVSENVGTITAALLEDTVDLTPVIRIAQGTRVQIRPEYDWYFADPSHN